MEYVFWKSWAGSGVSVPVGTHLIDSLSSVMPTSFSVISYRNTVYANTSSWKHSLTAQLPYWLAQDIFIMLCKSSGLC